MTFDEKYSFYADVIECELSRRISMLPSDSKVVEAMGYSLLGGGKRVRGVLTLACCEAVSGSYEAALPAACAIEMLHCYSLIHDDLPCMDNDVMRRGKPSCHVAFGETVALLAGDALLTEAFRLIADIADPVASSACAGILAFAAGSAGMVYGQELDLRYSENAFCTEEQLMQIHKLKTGCLLKASAAMGAACGGADAAKSEALIEYASNIGFAFQIVDDILDVTADEAEFGKPVGSDSENGKTTFVTLFGLEAAKEQARVLTEGAEKLLAEAFSAEASEFLIATAWWLYNRKK